MRFFAFAIPFLAAAAAWADDLDGLPSALSIDTPRRPILAVQEDRPERDRVQEPENRLTAMEYVTIHSEFSTGLLYTNFGGDLDLETDSGAYVRYALKLGNGFTGTLTYRHYDFTSSDLPGDEEEHVLLRGVLAGVSWRREVLEGIEVDAGLHGGLMRWESHDSSFRDEPGYIGSAEGAVSIRLSEGFRIRLGAAIDLVKTDFHQDSTDLEMNLSGLLGLEIRS